MTKSESPGAVAAHGASEVDPLGGKVDSENSLRILIAQRPRLRTGSASRRCSYRRYDHAGHHPRPAAASPFNPTEVPPRAHHRRCSRVLHRRQVKTEENIMTKTQRHALQKQKETTIPTQYENPWLEAAAEAGSEYGKILKFVKGEWLIGEDIVPEGTEFIAYVDELARAWIKFEDQSVTDRRIVKVAIGRPPEREGLGDTDPSEWELGEDGKPRDPWVLQWLLPMSPVDAVGDLVVFATSSKGGIGAIGTLCQVYGRSPRNGLLPIVALKCASYKHPQYGKVLKPDLPIVGWHGTAPQVVGSNSTHPSSGAGGACAPANDLMDEIPF
jgi:hypothetical protein